MLSTIFPEPPLGNRINEMNKIVRKYKASPSIIRIKQNVNIDEKFKFRDISPNELKTCVYKLVCINLIQLSLY